MVENGTVNESPDHDMINENIDKRDDTITIELNVLNEVYENIETETDANIKSDIEINVVSETSDEVPDIKPRDDINTTYETSPSTHDIKIDITEEIIPSEDTHRNDTVSININESNNEKTSGNFIDGDEDEVDTGNENERVERTIDEILNVLLTDSDSSLSISSDSADSALNNDNEEEIDFKKIVLISEGFQFAAGNDIFIAENSFADTVTCLVCFSTLSAFDIIYCIDCDLRICLTCMESHIKTKIREGLVRINCAGESCSRGFSNQLVAAFAPKLVPVYIKNQVELEKNPNRKTCPNCHKIETCHEWSDIEKRKITCNQCSLVWCFYCHAPWHSGLKCESFTKDAKNYDKKALKFWAKNKGTKTRNATKCPSCNFYIERISGCDHMTCMRCKTSFCYRCGEKYRSLGWFGDHYSTYSFLGCKYNLTPNKPMRRVAIRSCCTVGAFIGCTVLAGIAVPVCAVGIVFSPIILSCYFLHTKC